MLEAAIADLRKNDWVVEDIFSALANDPLSRTEYGWKQTAHALQWFKDTAIPVFLQHRVDSPEFPCISVVSGNRTEDLSRASMADQGDVYCLDPTAKVATSPVKIIGPFTPKEYDSEKGTITLPKEFVTDYVTAGQFLVSSKSGKAYQILSVSGPNTFEIKPETADDFMGAYVAPKTSVWNLHKETVFVQEEIVIGCHAQSDPVQGLWLHDLVWYALLRYKEAYFESRGFELTTQSSGAMDLNPNFTPERVFSRYITLRGVLPIEFIKWTAPRIDGVKGGIKIIDGPRTPELYQAQVQAQAWKMQKDPPGDDT